MIGARILMWPGISALTVTANDVLAHAANFAACGDPGATNTPNVQVLDGSGSYSFLWELVSAPAQKGPFVPNGGPTVQNPTWRAATPTVCEGDSPDSENWRVTVTDLVTGRTGAKTINVRIFWANLS